MSRPPRRRSPPNMCPEPPRIRSHTPPLKRTSGQRSPERRGRSPLRGKRPLRNNSPHRSRSPIERRPPKSGPPAREFSPISRNEREPLPLSRNRGKREFRGAGPSETANPRFRHSRSPVAAEESSKDRPFPAKRPFSGPPENVVTSKDQNKFKSGADFQGEDDDELERPIFRGPDSGESGYDLSELKRIQVKILRKIKSDGTVDNVNRTVPNLEEITPVRRMGEGNRPIFERYSNVKVEKPSKNECTVVRYPSPPTDRENPRLDGPSRIDSNQYYPAERDRARERDREMHRQRDGRVPFESTKPYHESDSHEKRSYSYGSRSGDDLRLTIERGREEQRYQPDFRKESHDKPRSVSESNVRGRMNERRPEHNYKHDDRDRDKERPRESERERTDYLPPRRPIQDRRKGSPPGTSSRRPSDRDSDFDRERHRGDKEQWERERGRESDVDRRRRPKSRERDDDRRETRSRETRPRRFDDRPEHRGSYKNSDYPQDKQEVEEEYEIAPAPHHVRGTRGGRGGGVGGWGAPHPGAVVRGGMFRGAPRAVRVVMRPPPPPYQPFFPPPVRPMMPFRGYPPRKSPEGYLRNRNV